MSAHVLWYLGIGYPSPRKRHVHPEFARMGFVRNRDQYASVRGGFLSLFPTAYGVHSPADAPARKRAMTFFPLFSARRKPGTWSA